ncbi:MAG: hypothetical protein LBN71_02345 [Tannerella sp.]|jgi:hypothetical protein|nr:hypothetical protein [Tannerella sp.]
MALFSFYSVRKPRQYEHKPIYWDPRREALEKRIRQVKMEMGEIPEDPEEYKASIRGSFSEGTTHLRRSKAKGFDVHERANRNMRLILIVVLLSVVFWYFFLR